MNQSPQFQMSVPFTPMVKRLVIANCAIWVGAVVILQGLILGGDRVFELFALVPSRVIVDFWVWQPFTYMFLHSTDIFHILFNMLALWWFGAELEQRWGGRFFLTYYLVCGVGAGLIYVVGALVYYWLSHNAVGLLAPLVGASGATFGLLLAYGLLFGERMIYFMMLFPMKAKYFTLIIGLVELVTLLNSGMGSQVANLAHLGGIAVGFLFLSFVARWRARAKAAPGSRRGRRLKLVVDNERTPTEKQNGPKYWN
jgi:membrane associated rhomboid family serine protease